ncbi:MAG: hypothetical protein K6U80_18900 [Firmicutes bacterium]|nr:hypothetical protein [Bacillota bacterium]
MTPDVIKAARVKLSQKIDQLFKDKASGAEERCRIAQELIDWYTGETGEYPSSWLLERLASYILTADKLSKFRRRHKSDYQVLSKRQLKIRRNREIRLED